GNAHNITYPAFGPRTVTLMVETNSGCQSLVKTKSITINSVPVAKFTHTQACLPFQSVNFTNNSTNADGTALSYLWNFGEPSSGAANTSTLVNPSHLYSTAGTYSVKLTATNAGGCAKDTTINIADVYPYAHGDFTVNPENCFNTATVFTSTSTGNGAAIATWYWDFGDGSAISNVQNPSYTYATPGTKTIKHWIKTVNGCVSDTMQKTVIVNPLPTADFTYTNPSCQNRTISFTDASAPNVGSLTTWAWDFNDPASGTANTSSLQNPQHSFSSTGVYNVKLIVTNSKGCVNPVFSRQVTIEARPAAGYIVPEVCLNDTYAQFTDTSYIAAGSITAWQWNFGDANSTVANPNTSTLQNPPHSYTAVGSYTVQLIVTSNAGCKDTLSHTLFVNGSFPVANFTVNNAGSLCANDSVRIVNTSTVFPGVITKTEVYWDNVGQPAVFETDNEPATNEVYSHLYPNFQSPLTKTYTIRFRAYSGGVCVNDKYQTITINAAPKVQFNSIPDTCLNIAPFQLTQASEVGAVPGTFAFTGPGVSATGIFDPSLVGPGIYTIHYTFTSNTGCRDSATRQIRVLEPPVANFGFGNPACEKNTLLFSDSSRAPVGTITTWTWDFADGSGLIVRNNATPFTHTFNQAGDYLVKLYVTTNHGCNSIVKAITVHINPLPKPSFTFPDTACLPASRIQFNNTSTIADGTENTFTYLWNFGDPASGPANASTAKNPVHIYAGVGPYSVNLKVKSGAGCIKDSTIIVNTIHPQPKARFEFSKPSVCIGDNVICLDRTDGKDGTLSAWYWSFGDNSYSTVQNPEHIYSEVGDYKVEFYSINSFGCNSDTISKTFTVYPYPKVNAGPDLLVLEGEQATINADVTGNDLQYLWTPNLFLNNNTVEQPITKPNQDITYLLKVTARGGCVKTDEVFVKVLMTPNIPNTFSPNNDGINDLWEIQYLNTYPNNRVQVFTRTGQLVFESKGYKTPWNGTFNGKPLPVDTYYYIIEPESGRKPVTGYVTIVK
ncbi:MAG: PKD domain-containing protein, partial [Ferruginibacter sp.]